MRVRLIAIWARVQLRLREAGGEREGGEGATWPRRKSVEDGGRETPHPPPPTYPAQDARLARARKRMRAAPPIRTRAHTRASARARTSFCCCVAIVTMPVSCGRGLT